jgi:hypothetical protein
MKKLFTLTLLALSGVAVKAQNIYGTMENWLTYTSDTATLERPEGWNGSDSVAYGVAFPGIEAKKQVFKEDTHVNGGSFAVRLESADLGLTVAPAAITNGTIEVDVVNQTFDIVGGTAVSERIIFLNAWIDYQPQGADEASVFIRAVLTGQGVGGADSVVGTGFWTSDGTAGYEHIGIPVTYVDENVVPDRVLIAFLTSEDFQGSTEGTTMYVDDVTISTTSTKNTPNAHAIKCYPNPTTGMLNVRSAVNEVLTLEVYSITGQLMHSQSFKGQAQADLSSFSNGMYFYKVSNTTGQVVKQDKLILNK